MYSAAAENDQVGFDQGMIIPGHPNDYQYIDNEQNQLESATMHNEMINT